MGKILTFIVLALAVFLGILWFRFPDILSAHISEQLKVPVSIDSMSLSPKRLGIYGITISNPQGAIQPTAFSCQSVDIKSSPLRFLKKKVVIDEIDIDGIYLDLEFDSASGTDGNWTRIMEGIGAPKPETKGQGSVLIERLVLTNIQVDVLYVKERSGVKRLPKIDRIELTNLSSEGDFPTDQIMNSVLGEMLKAVFIQQNLKNMLNNLLNAPSNSIYKTLKPFKGFFFNSTLQLFRTEGLGIFVTRESYLTQEGVFNPFLS